MKKSILILLIAFSVTSTAHAQNYGWLKIDPTSISGTPDFSDVFFTDANTGWITSSSLGNIFKTQDGTASFSTQATSLGTNAIHMLDTNTGYSGGASGFIYNTADGGLNWPFFGTITTTLSDITFPGTTGYACGNSGKIYEVTSSQVNAMTSNAGTTNLSSITFPTTSEGWVCGAQVILHYSNSTWNGDQSYPSGFYNAIYFVNNTTGWAVGDNGRIIHTTDGINWVTQTNLDTNSLFDVFFLTPSEGWAVGFNGTILHTTNGGTDWNIEGENLTSAFLRGVYFVSTTNGNVGYVVGNGKTLLKYTELSSTGSTIIETLQFDVFPNPAKNKFEIRSSKFFTKNCKIELHDLYGEILIEKQIAKGHEKVEIDVNNLASGVYFCTMKTDKKSSTKKLIIE